MLALYLASLLFGGLLIGVSLVFGGGDADVDLDADVDADVDLDGDAADASWLPLLSMRFWTFAAAAFGLTGTLLTLVGIAGITTAITSVLTALLLGYGAARLFQHLHSDTVTADIGLARLVGNEARVLLTVRPGDHGKIVVDSLAGRVELLARSRDAAPIPPGATVLIAHIDDGVAEVTSLTGPSGAVRPRQPTR